jgi:LAO/AO transport system kinase
VLAVDPSSHRTGGSLLGDKTRMAALSAHPDAYVRPSPTRGVLGGVAEATGDAAALCEAAGYDTVLVESVGVGQSEVLIDSVVDCVVLVIPPAGGDELQGVKKGITEVADIVVVNKSDGALAATATHTAIEYRRAMALVRPKWGDEWRTEVLQCSALERTRLDGLAAATERFREALTATGAVGAAGVCAG